MSPSVVVLCSHSLCIYCSKTAALGTFVIAAATAAVVVFIIAPATAAALLWVLAPLLLLPLWYFGYCCCSSPVASPGGCCRPVNVVSVFTSNARVLEQLSGLLRLLRLTYIAQQLQQIAEGIRHGMYFFSLPPDADDTGAMQVRGEGVLG